MFVNEVNDVKIYNLSAGKTVPEFEDLAVNPNQFAENFHMDVPTFEAIFAMVLPHLMPKLLKKYLKNNTQFFFEQHRQAFRESNNKTTRSGQFEIMVEFMVKHSQLAKGHLKAPNARQSSNVLWQTLSEELNASGPPFRDVAGWKKWLTDRRKRSQLMKKVDSRRQIELIQDFEMPGVSTSIRISPDQQYILATGTYKPRLKCFEVCNLSIKFERCFDSDVTTFEVISDDYSKIALLQCDRFVEIHSASGRHYRLRIPRFGRDMKYHKPTCDLFIVGTRKDIYRLNLERGQFLQPFESDASCINACDVNPEHGLLVVGAKEGVVEAWDPRTKMRCATLDIALKLSEYKDFPSVSAISFKNGLQMGVGTASGHVLLYDIRSREPLLVKNHLNRAPIKRIAFNPNHQTIYSLDEVMLKLWDEQTGKQIAYIESATKFNDFCTIPTTGMFFLAQEDIKMLTYYIPSMGPAPRWCSFLDNLIEEIESEVVEHIFDDYQFVTAKELEELGLDNLIGTNLLKGYMHGYFMDVRLYNKAKALVGPFAFDRFQKEKVRQEIDSERKSRLQLKANLPKVNQELAFKLIEERELSENKNKINAKPSLLEDSRFKAMFEYSDFAINKNAEEYKLLAPVLTRLDKSKTKDLKKDVLNLVNQLHEDEKKVNAESDNDQDLFGFSKSDHESNSGEESTDDENLKEYATDMKRAYKEVKQQREIENEDENVGKIREKEFETAANLSEDQSKIHPNLMVTKTGLSTVSCHEKTKAKFNNATKVSLQDRLKKTDEVMAKVEALEKSVGNRKMTFELCKPTSRSIKKREYEMKKHREERKQLVRPIQSLKLKKVNFK